MNKKILTILFIITISFTVYPEEIRHSAGKTDWIRGVITAEGTGAVSADEEGNVIDEETGRRISFSSSRDASYEKAREKAVHDASSAINEIYVDPSLKIKDIIIRDPSARQKIAHYIHEYSRFREKPAGYLKTGCELELKLGYILNAINYSFPEEMFPLRNDVEISTKYTSLIIDTRGLKIQPVLLPSVLNESGLEVYSRNNISAPDAAKHLAVSYTYNEKDAVKHKKAGTQPFFCTALKSLNGNPVISDEDVKRIFSHKQNLTYLKKCRVIFIIDR